MTIGPAGAGRDTPAPPELAGETHGAVLGLFGGADPRIPPESIAGFERALEAASVPRELHAYPGAPHSFFDRKAVEFADAWNRVLRFVAERAPPAEHARAGQGARFGARAPHPPIANISTRRSPAVSASSAVSADRSSEYRSPRRRQRSAIACSISSSDAPPRTSTRRSIPDVANRHVNSSPFADSRARVHAPQNGCVTDAITPISPAPSRYRQRAATSPG